DQFAKPSQQSREGFLLREPVHLLLRLRHPFDCAQGRLLRSLQEWEFCADCYFEKWDAAREIFQRQAVYSLSILRKMGMSLTQVSTLCSMRRWWKSIRII